MGDSAGKSGARNGSGAKAQAVEEKSEQQIFVESLGDEITDYDWSTWAEDSWVYEAAVLGEKLPTRSAATGVPYEEYELERIKKIAPKIKEASETQTVKLDGENYSTLYRGEYAETLAEAKAKYKTGGTITNTQLTSYALKPHIAENYADGYLENNDGSGVKIVIKNTNTHGKSVGAVTDPFGAGGSYEAITPIGLKSKVKSTRFDKKTSTFYVELENSATPKKTRKR